MRFEQIAVVVASIVLIVALALSGCQSDRTVGWNPQTTPPQCQEFKDGEFVGPFLKKEECAGVEKPVDLPEALEPQDAPL